MQLSSLNARHYFIGSTPSTLFGIQNVLAEEFPHVVVSGVLSPPFRTPNRTELTEWAHSIDSSGTNYVWLSLGSPKQDIVAFRLSQLTSAKIIAVGAAFDFFSKSKPEAPILIQKAHLEWFFRLLQEPKRLWKRYTVGIAYFLLLIFNDFVGRR
jgi:N-acetylglucosaminyldiphosphoundecaprenol N-acetyl-beta-D-mannosaminyltransferase